jgi:hypothetical protein
MIALVRETAGGWRRHERSPPVDAAHGEGGFDPERFFALMRKVGHGRALGLEYRAIGRQLDRAGPAVARGTGRRARKRHPRLGRDRQPDRHRGGASVWMALGHFQPIVTIDLRLDYLRPAVKGETVIARCECYKLTRAIGFVRGIAHGGDPEARPIAQATGTFMLNP